MKRFLSFLLAAVMASSLLVLPAGAAEVVCAAAAFPCREGEITGEKAKE